MFDFKKLIVYSKAKSFCIDSKNILTVSNADKVTCDQFKELLSVLCLTLLKDLLALQSRVWNSVSFALLIVFTTPFPALIKSIRTIGVPDSFLMILNLAYKFIFILSRTVEETYFALRSRLSGNIKKENIRSVVGGRVYFIFRRSQIMYEGTYNAMVSRGYDGIIRLPTLTHLNYIDIISLFVIIITGIIIILL